MNDKFYFARDLLLMADNVSDDVKYLIKNKEFVEENRDLIIDLAKILMVVDKIYLEDDEIIAKKEILKTPKIDIEMLIFKFLYRLKYNQLTPNDIQKIEYLKQFPKYKELYTLLNKSLLYKEKFKKLSDDELKLSLNELKEFLDG